MKLNINIEGKNILLKPLGVRDIKDTYVSSLNNYNIVKYTEARHKKWTHESVKKNIFISKKNKIPFLGIFLKKNKMHIGSIRLPGFDKYNKKILLGIMVFNNEFRKKGYGIEALNLISDYLLNQQNINKIIADYCTKNIASKKLFTRCKYKKEGRLKKNIFVDGKFEDSIIVSRLKK